MIITASRTGPGGMSAGLCYTTGMVRKFWQTIRPAVFWRHRRGSWQYDVMVALILIFTFASPRSWFRDQPNPQSVVLLPGEPGHAAFWIDPELIGAAAPDQWEKKIRPLLEKRAGRSITILKVEPVKDDEGNLKGYLVRTRS
jgi:hypothetical protein